MKKFIKLSLITLTVITLTACGSVKLEKGDSSIVQFKEGKITAEDLYEVLKETYGAEKIVDLIDNFLLNKMYERTSDETAYVNNSLKTVKDQATSLGTDVDTYVKYYYNVANEKAFKEYVALNYKRSLWIEEYAQETVTDTQINDYYETETTGDMTLSHILITSNATNDMTEEEKNKAETEALNQATQLITRLKNGEDFAKLAKEYSKDEETKENGGSLGVVNTGSYASEVIDAAKKIEVGSYSTSPVKSTYGYHIIYKSKQEDKPKLDETLKSTIRATIGKEISQESTFYVKALEALREKNEMKFKDNDLFKSYENYMLMNSSN